MQNISFSRISLAKPGWDAVDDIANAIFALLPNRAGKIRSYQVLGSIGHGILPMHNVRIARGSSFELFEMIILKFSLNEIKCNDFY